MRGDRPFVFAFVRHMGEFTPHARGSTSPTPAHLAPDCVYPACAGIDLRASLSKAENFGLPRMRGDRPLTQGRFRCV